MELIKRYLTNSLCYRNNVNKADKRYTDFQARGALGAMLHSVGCNQPSAQVFINKWDKITETNICLHGVIDANTGAAYQLMPWNFRCWHAGKAAGNNTLIGVEMCESAYIRYLQPGEAGYTPAKFIVLDKAKAQADCKRAYDSAVQMFAIICKENGLDPMTGILSHYEGGKKGIASNHGDPEHYWKGLGMSYTMDGFRKDVKEAMAQSSPQTEEDHLWRIQVGAFTKKENAENFLKEVQKVYPYAIKVQVR